MRRFLAALSRSTATLLVLLAVSCGTSDEDHEDEPTDTSGDVMSDAPADTGRDVMSDLDAPDCGYIELEGDCGACVPMDAFEYTEEGGCVDFSTGERVQLACVDRMSIAGALLTCVVVDGRIFVLTHTIEPAVSESDDWRHCSGDEYNDAWCMY